MFIMSVVVENPVPTKIEKDSSILNMKPLEVVIDGEVDDDKKKKKRRKKKKKGDEKLKLFL